MVKHSLVGYTVFIYKYSQPKCLLHARWSHIVGENGVCLGISMANKVDQEKLYWSMQRESALRDEYSSWLIKEKLERGPNSAHVFAIKIHSQPMAGEMSERQIILALVGELPYMYD